MPGRPHPDPLPRSGEESASRQRAAWGTGILASMTSATLDRARAPNQYADLQVATGWRFAAPGLSIIAIVIGLPLLYALLLTVSSFTLLHPRLHPLVGIDNFRRVMSDEYFWHSVWVT